MHTTRAPSLLWHDFTDLVQARYLANCLGELDRFLHHLLDAISPPVGPRRHNAALKLAALLAHDLVTPDDQRRLRALGRSRACLRHCRGLVTRGDTADAEWLTSGWIDPRTAALRRYRIGTVAWPTGRDVLDVCAFYDDLAIRLLASFADADQYRSDRRAPAEIMSAQRLRAVIVA